MQEAALSNGESRRGSLPASRALSVALAAFVGVLSLLVAPSDVLAATAAPMCNELAQSIEAPPTIWPYHGGSIRSVPPCPASSRFWQVDANSDRAERVPPIVLREAPVGAFGGDVTIPVRVRVLIPDATRLDLPVAHVPDVYRPPRG